MNDIQQKLFELLTDIDEICKREGIPYYLCAETALSASVTGKFFNSCAQASVAMTPENAMRFVAAVEKENRADRAMDSMLTNKHYPDFTLRYGDPSTLMLQLPASKALTRPFIAVTIHLIKYQPKRLNIVYRCTGLFWTACSKSTASIGKFSTRAAIGACHAIRNIFGGKLFSRTLFKLWVSLLQTRKGAKRIAICTDPFHFSSKLVSTAGTVALEGREFSTFGDLQGYLTTAYGPDYATAVPSFAVPSASLLISTNVSYDRYMERLNQQLDVAEMRRQQKSYDLQQRKVSVYNKKIDRYYAVVDRTDKRFAMYEMYMPMKEQLLQLDKEGRYDELNELLKPYRSALRHCYKKKLGLCFDKDIFEITMKILVREGSGAYAKRLRALVPEAHWQPMVITNYKGEPV